MALKTVCMCVCMYLVPSPILWHNIHQQAAITRETTTERKGKRISETDGWKKKSKFMNRKVNNNNNVSSIKSSWIWDFYFIFSILLLLLHLYSRAIFFVDAICAGRAYPNIYLQYCIRICRQWIFDMNASDGQQEQGKKKCLIILVYEGQSRELFFAFLVMYYIIEWIKYSSNAWNWLKSKLCPLSASFFLLHVLPLYYTL